MLLQHLELHNKIKNGDFNNLYNSVNTIKENVYNETIVNDISTKLSSISNETGWVDEVSSKVKSKADKISDKEVKVLSNSLTNEFSKICDLVGQLIPLTEEYEKTRNIISYIPNDDEHYEQKNRKYDELDKIRMNINDILTKLENISFNGGASLDDDYDDEEYYEEWSYFNGSIKRGSTWAAYDTSDPGKHREIHYGNYSIIYDTDDEGLVTCTIIHTDGRTEVFRTAYDPITNTYKVYQGDYVNNDYVMSNVFYTTYNPDGSVKDTISMPVLMKMGTGEGMVTNAAGHNETGVNVDKEFFLGFADQFQNQYKFEGYSTTYNFNIEANVRYDGKPFVSATDGNGNLVATVGWEWFY